MTGFGPGVNAREVAAAANAWVKHRPRPLFVRKLERATASSWRRVCCDVVRVRHIFYVVSTAPCLRVLGEGTYMAQLKTEKVRQKKKWKKAERRTI
jgi:hypothetical protein